MEITKNTIYKVFREMGMPLGLKGFDYACDLVLCIKEAFDTTGSTNMKITHAYNDLALKYDVDPQSIERATRHFIETGFNRIKPKDIERIFGYTFWKNGYPPTKEFIYSVYNYMMYDGE